MTENILYCGDNLDVLKSIPPESVDLCYIDPPFFTSRNYEVIWGDGAEIRQFEDRWVKMGDTGRYSKDINVYLEFMEPRIREIYRILKPTGSFYLHCDYHADAYLRVLCDQIFGYGNLNTQIIWDCGRVGGYKTGKKGFVRQHDIILFYRKGTDFTFNPIILPLREDYIKKYFNKKDENGLYQQRNRKQKDGTIRIDKQYLKDSIGDPCGDIFSIPMVNSIAKERLGYPTQKPEALLKRIIQASSNEGDVVLDAFCGCGTTLAVAKRLNRHFIGIDVSPTACRLVAKRVEYPIGKIVGLPLTEEEIKELTGYEFQNAVINLLDPSLSVITVNNRGADGGIDGTYYDLLISVKKYNAGRKDLDEFVATIYRNKQSGGIFIALGYTAGFTKEIARLKREQEIQIHAFTLADLLDKKHVVILREENQKHGKLI